MSLFDEGGSVACERSRSLVFARFVSGFGDRGCIAGGSRADFDRALRSACVEPERSV